MRMKMSKIRTDSLPVVLSDELRREILQEFDRSYEWFLLRTRPPRFVVREKVERAP